MRLAAARRRRRLRQQVGAEREAHLSAVSAAAGDGAPPIPSALCRNAIPLCISPSPDDATLAPGTYACAADSAVLLDGGDGGASERAEPRVRYGGRCVDSAEVAPSADASSVAWPRPSAASPSPSDDNNAAPELSWLAIGSEPPVSEA